MARIARTTVALGLLPLTLAGHVDGAGASDRPSTAVPLGNGQHGLDTLLQSVQTARKAPPIAPGRQTSVVLDCDLSGSAYKVGSGSTRTIWSESTMACEFAPPFGTTNFNTYKVDGPIVTQPSDLSLLFRRVNPSTTGSDFGSKTFYNAVDSNNCGAVSGNYGGTDCTYYYQSDWHWAFSAPPGGTIVPVFPAPPASCVNSVASVVCESDRLWGYPSYFTSAF